MRNSLLFDTFTDAEYNSVIGAFDLRPAEFPAGSIIIDEGDTVNRFWYIGAGALHAVRQYYDGSMNLVQLYNTEDYLGLDLVFTRTQLSPLQIVAATDTVLTEMNAGMLFNPDIDTVLREKLTRNAMRILANDSLRKQVKIDVLYKRSLKARICEFLSHMQNRYKSNDFEINMNREQLAQYLGVNRSALSNEISKMREEKLIACRKGHFVILDAALCENKWESEDA